MRCLLVAVTAIAVFASCVSAACTPFSSYLSSYDVERGVAVVADPAGCSSEPRPTDCVDSQCRKCWLYNTTFAPTPYAVCPRAMHPAIRPPESISCTAFLLPTEGSAGNVSAIYDATCTLYGGLGCLPNFAPCRRCSTYPTPSSRYWPCDLDAAICDNNTGLARVIGIIDASCLTKPTLPGCTVQSPCRRCRLQKLVTNAHLPDCAMLYTLATPLEVSVASAGSLWSAFEALQTDLRALPDDAAQFSETNTAAFAQDVGYYVIVSTLVVGGVGIAIGLAVLIVYATYRRRATASPILVRPMVEATVADKTHDLSLANPTTATTL
ncbi:hypothetical protein SDRG_08770 [Saprolegnia diclina VS20]|uniref:Membrane-associated protein n=1 Tax=Saprolegnia diclina (strain VS20) TaxID=1156394 RepID=T0QFZ8_SAPDV|nr:hypothetical protein SDRG_08770 [Saprolegnia diclina VS20]EQC33666.1 hypothetical protein SDRG_08770 [Saprolegnia diclina VS20]|eukprot:XP_008612889.1 hypothetical protein SDRG_08770 [Saprolegnia diclina VS20]